MENKDIPNSETNIEEVKDLNTETILGEAKTEEKPKETMTECEIKELEKTSYIISDILEEIRKEQS